jgi:hypothetical protein
VAEEIDEGFNSQKERRTHDRTRLIVDVFFDGTDATGVANTQDISLGGFYMTTQTPIPEGALLLVRIPLGPGKQIVCNAEVVYSNPGRGVGVRFKDLSSEDQSLLDGELTAG